MDVKHLETCYVSSFLKYKLLPLSCQYEDISTKQKKIAHFNT